MLGRRFCVLELDVNTNWSHAATGRPQGGRVAALVPCRPTLDIVGFARQRLFFQVDAVISIRYSNNVRFVLPILTSVVVSAIAAIAATTVAVTGAAAAATVTTATAATSAATSAAVATATVAVPWGLRLGFTDFDFVAVEAGTM